MRIISDGRVESEQTKISTILKNVRACTPISNPFLKPNYRSSFFPTHFKNNVWHFLRRFLVPVIYTFRKFSISKVSSLIVNTNCIPRHSFHSIWVINVIGLLLLLNHTHTALSFSQFYSSNLLKMRYSSRN